MTFWAGVILKIRPAQTYAYDGFLFENEMELLTYRVEGILPSRFGEEDELEADNVSVSTDNAESVIYEYARFYLVNTYFPQVYDHLRDYNSDAYVRLGFEQEYCRGFLATCELQPPYPSLESRGILDEDEELEMYLTLAARSMVWRYSQRHNVYGGWVYVNDIHLLPASAFHDRCGAPYCSLCDEYGDRIMNAAAGYFDGIPEQLVGIWEVNHDHDDLGGWNEELESRPDIEDLWDQDENICVEPAPGVYLAFQNDVQECSVCFCEMEGGLVGVPSCLHRFHWECLKRWSEENDMCPLCRCSFDIKVAEGDVEDCSYSFKVEYTAINHFPDGRNVEYDDPVDWLEYTPREGLYHLYILSGVVPSGCVFRVSGNIRQIDVLDGERLANVVSQYEIKSGEFEIEVITLAPIDACFVRLGQVVDASPMRGNGEKIMLVGLGTYGDIQPLLMLRDEIRRINYESVVMCNKGFDGDIVYDAGSLLESYSQSPTIVPGIDMVKSVSVVEAVVRKIEDEIVRYDPDLIVTSSTVVGVPVLAAKYGVPVVYYQSIPRNEGALVFMEQSSEWKKWYARMLESITTKVVHSVAVVKGLGDGYNPVIPEVMKTVYGIAPELNDDGVGVLLLGDELGVEYAHDVFVTLGSVATKEDEGRLMRSLKKTTLRVLFQSNFYSGVDDGITFIGKCQHRDIMRGVPVVICHGGSGTLQTALHYGCRVLVFPKWADQKFWPGLCEKRGFDVRLGEKSEVAFLRQVMQMARLGHQSRRLTASTISNMVDRLLEGVVFKPRDLHGTFIFSDKETSCISVLSRSVCGDSKYEPVGIGFHARDNSVLYMEYKPCITIGSVVSCSNNGSYVLSKGIGIDKNIRHIRYIPMTYDPNRFMKLVPESQVCAGRNVVDQYLRSQNVEFSLEDWHNERKDMVGQIFSGSERVEYKDVSLGGSLPLCTWSAPRDGDCLYHCVARQLELSVAEVKVLAQVEYRKIGQEFGYDWTVLPYYTSDGGDYIPLAVARGCNVSLEIHTGGYVVTVNEGHQVVRVLLQNSHYSLFV